MLLNSALGQTAPPDALAAAQWVDRMLVGPLGTSVAVIGVAWFGFALMAGRLSLRRGGLLVLGCFVLFGAPGIARALIGLAQAGGTTTAPISPQQITVPPPPVAVAPPPFDPYAGASVPNAGH
jgi:type IV secretory pathway VirB2 component (pilin)